MQKVESSSLFIRSLKGPGNGAFFVPSDDDGRLCRNRQSIAGANWCQLSPLERQVVLLAMRGRESVAPLRRLRVNPQREARVFVAELVGRVRVLILPPMPQTSTNLSRTSRSVVARMS